MDKKKYILAIDEGTTSCRAMLYDTRRKAFVRSSSLPLKMHYPSSGCAQQDADEIYDAVRKVIADVLRDIDAREVLAAGITNQRETAVIWDKSGKPLAPAISWQCRRTINLCDDLRARGLCRTIKQKTGLVIDAYFSATKYRWLCDGVEGAEERLSRGDLMLGTIESYLVYRLTGGKFHVTDVTNASRTMLMNLSTLSYDDELLALLSIPKKALPKIVDCDGYFGEIDGLGIPIHALIGDQQAALFGQACFNAGDAKCTYGTGAFILANLGGKPQITDSPLITTVAYKALGKTAYALEGSVFNAGTTVEWLTGLGIIKHPKESEKMALAANPDSEVYLVPAFTGLGAPHWDMNARAAIFGLTRDTGANELAKAALEATGYRVAEVFELMQSELGLKIPSIRADGGGAENSYLMQFQSDILGAEVVRCAQKEATSLGAVYMAMLGSGYIDDLSALSKAHSTGTIYSPSGADMSKKLQGWKSAVNKIKHNTVK